MPTEILILNAVIHLVVRIFDSLAWGGLRLGIVGKLLKKINIIS